MNRAMLLLAAVLLAAAPHVVHGQCYVNPAIEGFELEYPPYYNSITDAMCRPGFYCPNSNISDPATFPRVCPPTPECLNIRRNYEFCPAQGPYEPEVCPPGFYCPNAKRKVPCPSGYYCPMGSDEPIECEPMAACPKETQHQLDLSGILVAVIACCIAGGLYFVYLKWRVSQAQRSVPEKNSWEGLSAEDRKFLADGITARRGEMGPLDFRFNDLHVDVVDKKKGTRKTLLESITGRIAPGRVTAIMGPSGAGKTVFFTTLLDKIGKEFETSGMLKVNGHEDISQFKQHIGYTPQDDVLHGELTVDDNIYFSSEFRLPVDWDADRKARYRDLVIQALGLSHVRNTIIGTESRRGVSGGQRKRASIAHELAAAPAAIFLDEPTTGLDATTAMELCQVLNGVAREADMTIAMVVHQPRIEIWNNLDQILLIAPGGRVVYEGPRSEAKAYFQANLGLDFSVGNPADVIIDGIANCRDECIKAWKEHLDSKVTEPSTPAQVATSDNTEVSTVPVAGFLRQAQLFHMRSLMKQSQSFQLIILYVLLGMVAAAMMASAAVRIYSQSLLVSPYEPLSSKPRFYIVPMISMFYLIATASSVSPVAIRTFGGEQVQFWRESSSGSLNRVAYFVGMSIAELYRLFLTSLFFTIVAYIMWNPTQGFWSFYFNQFLCHLCFDAQASFLGMLMRPTVAPLLTTICGVFVSLMNGFPGIPVVGFVAFSWYSAEALVSANVVPMAHVFDIDFFDRQWGYTLHRETTDYAVLFIIFILYKLIGMTLLFVLNRDKQR